MARRRSAEKRTLTPDPKYNSELVTRVINYLMQRGKKSVAERIVYGALEEMATQTGQDPLEIMVKAIDNMKPKVEVKSRRIGGATYQVPTEINRGRQLALALRWLVQYATARKGMQMHKSVAMEMLDAYNNQGNVIKKKDDTHKMAQANRAFAHYAW